jgi:hypothetical protein
MMVPWRARLPRESDWPTPSRVNGVMPVKAPNHDGDTITLDCDRYDNDASQWSLRLLATFLPELDQPGGLDCRTWVTAWLFEQTAACPHRWPFMVDTMPASATTDTSKLKTTLERYICLVSNWDRTRILNHEIAEYAAMKGYGRGIGGG